MYSPYFTPIVKAGGSGGTSLPISDSTALFSDNSDTSKLLAFELSGITTGTTRTVTWPDASFTMPSTFVTSATGTASQVTVSGSTGAVTFSLPQSIATTSTPQFARVGLGQAAHATVPLAVTAGNDVQAALITGGSITGSGTTAFMGETGTWNTSGTVTGRVVNYTDTASNASSLFVDYQVAGSSRLAIRKSGSVISSGGGYFGGSGTAGNPPASGNYIALQFSATTAYVFSFGGAYDMLLGADATAADALLIGGSAGSGKGFTIGTNLPVLIGNKVTNYKSVTTAGWGVPAIYASARSTAQTAAVASVATYTVGAADGSFEVSANVNVTTSTTHNFTVTATYTDETNTSRTLTLPFVSLAGTTLTAITNVTGAGPYEGVPLRIRCKAATAITIASTGTFTTVTYNIEGDITQKS